MRAAHRSTGTAIAGVGVAIAILLALIGGVAATMSFRSGVAEERRAVEGEALRSAELIQRYLLGQIRTLQAAAPGLRGSDQQGAARILEQLTPSNLGFSGGIALTDAEGRVRAAASQLSLPDRLSDSALLDAVARGISYDVGAATTYGGTTPPVLPMAASLDEGTDRGALVGWIRLDAMASQLTPFRAADQKGFLIDRSGQVIGDDQPVTDLRINPTAAAVVAEADRIVDGNPLSRVGITGLSGSNRLAALARVPLCRCAVVIERPMRTTIARQRGDLAQLLLALLAASTLGGAAAVRFGQRLNGQLHDEAVSRDRAARLQALNDTLPRAANAGEVTDQLTAAIIEGVSATRASAVIIQRRPGDATGEQERPALTPLEEQALDAGDLVVLSHMAHGSLVDAAALPMRVGRRTHGIVEMRWSSATVLTDEASDYLRSIARQGAVALERAERQATDRVQRGRAERLQRALAEVARASTREDVLQAVREQCIPAIDAVMGGVVKVPESCPEDGPDGLPAIDGAGSSDSAAELIDVDQRLWPLVKQAERSGNGLLRTLRELRESDPDAAGALIRHGAGMVGVWPVVGTRRVHGTLLVLLPDDDDPRVEAPTRLGALSIQLAQALDRAELYEMEHEIARTLQRSLIELQPPSLPTLHLSTYYRAAAESMDVGGDWFDAIVVGSDDLRVMIGDLVGHGLTAAAAMGRLRGAAHTLAGHLRPEQVLARLDELAMSDPDCFSSTVAVLQVHPEAERLICAIAGHPPPLLLDHEGRASLLSDGGGPPLGLGTGRHHQADVGFGSGCSILLYTDGLVERRGETIDAGLDRLVAAADALGDPRADGWLDRLVEQVAGAASDDDIAAVLLTPP